MLTKIKYNQQGVSHHLLLPFIAIVAVGCIGVYLTFASKAATGTHSGRMGYTYYNGTEGSTKLNATLESDGRNEVLLTSGDRIKDNSFGNDWLLVAHPEEGRNGKYLYAYSADLAKKEAYDLVDYNELAEPCTPDGLAKTYTLIEDAEFVPEGNTSTGHPPHIVYRSSKYDCATKKVLETAIMRIDAYRDVKKVLMQDKTPGVNYKVRGVGANGTVLLSQVTDGAEGVRYLTYTYDGKKWLFSKNYSASYAPPRLSRDGSKLVVNRMGNDGKKDHVEILDAITGVKQSEPGILSSITSGKYQEVVAVNQDASKLLYVQKTSYKAKSAWQGLYVLDTKTKKSLLLNSGTSLGSRPVFAEATFSTSDIYAAYTKFDTKYSTYSIRRTKVDGSQSLVTKDFPYDPAGKATLRIYW